jgi:hypothetical protein
MAPEPGLLTINFTGNNPSGNRIAYQLSTDPVGVYTYVNSLCLGACTEAIPILLDDLTCDTVTYQGYVQALCQDISSLVGRILFTITFTPAEPCYSERLRCNEVGVQELTITDIGNGYAVPPAAAPAITFSSGAATADAYIADDGVASLDMLTLVPAIGAYVDNTYYIGCTGSTGPGDWANTFLTVVVAGGVITSVVPTSPLNTSVGSGHVIGDTLTLDGVAGLPAGSTIDILTLYPTGTLLEAIVTVSGTYTVAPTAVIDPPGGGAPVTATVDVVMERCDKWKPTQCDSNPTAMDIQLEFTQETIFCTDTHAPMVIPAGYTQAHDGCCYICKLVTFTATDTSQPVLTYLDFVTGQWIQLTLLNGVPNALGIVEDAYYIYPMTAPVTIVSVDCL